MGEQVQVKKGKNNNGCLWIIVAAVFLVCFVPILCVGLITAALVTGVVSDVDLEETSFSEAFNDAESARIEISTGVGEINIDSLGDSNNLFEGDITYFGEIDFTAGGGADRVVRLEQLNVEENIFGVFDVFNIVTNSEEVAWNIGLAPEVPITLDIESGIEDSTLNLDGLNLNAFAGNFGLGDISITLPQPEQSYTVDLNAGVGNIIIMLPEGAAVRLEANQGIGNLNVERLQEVSSEESPVGNIGVWETEGFGNADTGITITINGGLGDITIR